MADIIPAAPEPITIRSYLLLLRTYPLYTLLLGVLLTQLYPLQKNSVKYDKKDINMFANLLHGKKILLGVTASISIYKSLELIRLYIKSGAQVRVVMS